MPKEEQKVEDQQAGAAAPAGTEDAEKQNSDDSQASGADNSAIETPAAQTETETIAGEEPENQNDAEMPELPDFSNMLAEAAASSVDMLNDVELEVKIELGRTELTVEEVLNLSEGSVVELKKLAGDPVDILVNEQLVARGEILVVNDKFCVRLNEIVPGVSERVNQD
ncbi:flagellar motor switch protein FliN [Planctomycetota bacterium]